MTAPSQTAWVDAHAHPGRCFLRGLPDEDRLRKLAGSDDVARAIDDLRAGGLAASSFSTVADLRVLGIDPKGGIVAAREFEPGEAWTDHERQLDALLELCRQGQVRLVREAEDLRRSRGEPPGMLLTCEGGDFLEGKAERLGLVYERGVRSITIVHYRVNEIGDIQTEPPRHGGLTDFGREVVREMNRLGMLIDLAHATWEVTRDVVECSSQPVMISHSYLATGSVAHPRLLREEHARVVAEAGGLIGAWPAGFELACFDDFVDVVLRLVEVLGPEHVAIGTDMDANYRPVVSNHREFPHLARRLRERGLGAEEVALVMGESFVRLFEAVRAAAA